jgi:ribosomal subunit interface protein
MAQPQITYRGMPHSPAMDARILELASRLEDLNPRITRCHVVVVETDHRKHKGNLFEVHVDLHIPGHEIVATRQANEDAYAAINEAFEVTARQLDEAVRRQRGHTPIP